MKKLIIWLAKRYNVSIERIIYKEVEKPIYVLETDVFNGDVMVKGNLTVKGILDIEGDATVYKNNE